MNIAFFTNNYLPNKYGVASAILPLRKNLENLGHKVYVFAPKFIGYQDEDRRVYRLPSIPWKSRGIKYPITLFDSPKIFKEFSKLNIDIIHTHHAHAFGRIAMKYARHYGKPLVYTYHTRYNLYSNYIPLPTDALRKYVGNISEKSAIRFARKCNKVISLSRGVDNYLADHSLRDKLALIPSGIDLKMFDYKSLFKQRESIRDELEIKRDDKVVVYSGRITKEKNFDFLYKVMVAILKEKDNVKFLVVGGGSPLDVYKQKAVEDIIVDKVIFTDGIPWKEVPRHLIAGDIFVNASTTETQGLALLEAKVLGLPAVAIKSMGIEDAVEDGKTGFLVNEDVEEFRSRIKCLLRDDDLRSSYKSNSLKSIEFYGERRATKDMINLYQSLI